MVTVQPAPHLLLRTDSGSQRWLLNEGTCWTIGRGDENDFVLGDRWISRNHAMLQSMENGEIYLIDLGSRNGSFVNGRRVSVPVTLRNGDHLTFGQTELEFYCPTHHLEQDDESREFTATATLHVRRLISVLVIDIRDYTVLTRQLDEGVLSEMIGQWFRRAGDIIRNHGSWVDKYIGDAVMAVWIHGTQEVSPQEMLSVVQSVDELHQMTNELSQIYPVPFPLRIGAGINTGYAMVGNTGSGDRPDYTALGDTVNAAFRLETITKQIGRDVAIGETTYQYMVPLLIACDPFKQHTVNLKGYDEPTNAYAASFQKVNEFLLRQAATPHS
ncbi:adenylate/guanylate cyclase domain-containing protein [Alkalinema pantanalense CENA528]|uniref:adenylate/guanylate cyclase domain-containing protein n=1 Tax=Alkalinema pantanalense TaxID=1620705 RepID=UPI003D6F5A72